MGQTIIEMLKIMGWLGVVLAILTFVNTICGIIKNLSEGQSFSWKILFKGLGKALVFYLCSILLAIGFTMLPYINTMITNLCEVELITKETLDMLSNVAVLSIIIAAIATQGKKALEGVAELLDIKVTNQTDKDEDEEDIDNEEEEDSDEEIYE